ncbi:MAG: STELLO glycosyltransferase family protein [Xanthobacteraceae bacterium]|nr:STELLO glycosyltransferase family protein [Xanthobacteraceae bacterium]
MRVPTALVVTTINAPNTILRALADGAERSGIDFIAIGDQKSPADFALDGCRFLDLAAQSRLPFGFARACPVRHYSRKNIGYLVALSEGAEIIIETDDDNLPLDGFWEDRQRSIPARRQVQRGWFNAYREFSDANIWPRGFPLDEIAKSANYPPLSEVAAVDSPIQQALANGNPDVDAVYRLALPLPQDFRSSSPIALGAGVWCPFNSQNTTWWKVAAPLLYLPSHCSFRMTDIWRSFVAQRIAWENGWCLTFQGPTVWQDRNEHNLMKDFEEEIPGYLHNRAIVDALSKLSLASGISAIADNLRICYRALVDLRVIGADELSLLDLWLSDLAGLAG